MTTMTIGTTPDITLNHIHGMLAGDIKEATHLEGWEAFKNFFMKLLDHLGISNDYKEKQLRDIYDKINGKINVIDEKSKDTLLPVLKNITNLTNLLPDNVVKSMGFKFSPSGTDKINLTIRVEDKTLPTIELPNTCKNKLMVAGLKELLMEDIHSSGVFRLKPSILSGFLDINNGYTVIDPSALQTTYDSFKYAISLSEDLDSSNAFIQQQVPNSGDLGSQAEHLEKHRKMQEQLAEAKNNLPEEFHFYRTEIDQTIGNLKTHEQTSQEKYQKFNDKWVNEVVEMSHKGLLRHGHLSKNIIDNRLAKHQQYVDGKNNLFTPHSLAKLERMTTQLRFLSETARLYDVNRHSKDFPTDAFMALKKDIADAGVQKKSDPLTNLLAFHIGKLERLTPGYETAFNEASLINEATADFCSTLTTVENMNSLYFDNQQSQHEHSIAIESKENLLTSANALPDMAIKESLINRATVAEMNRQLINSIGKKFSDVEDVIENEDQSNLLSFDLKEVFSELHNLNDQLPQCERKAINQTAIDSLYSHAINRKHGAWVWRIATVPVAPGEAALDNVQKLEQFKKEVQDSPMTVGDKANIFASITDLITQHQSAASVETKLHNYNVNPYITQEQINQLNMESGHLTPSERKVKINKDIQNLKDIKQQLASINDSFAGVKKDIADVLDLNAVYTDELVVKYDKIKSDAIALPDGPPKTSLLANIDAENTNINNIKSREKRHAKAGNLLSAIAEAPIFPRSEWESALISLQQAAAWCKPLPESVGANDLKRRLGKDMATATDLLKKMASSAPNGTKRESYMAQVANDYRFLKDIITNHKYLLPNEKEVLSTLRSFKKEHRIPDRPFPGWSMPSLTGLHSNS